MERRWLRILIYLGIALVPGGLLALPWVFAYWRRANQEATRVDNGANAPARVAATAALPLG
jgi:hypothetical protein